jgi:serine protease
MKARYPALTPQELDNLLAGGSITEDLGTPGHDAIYGHGLIDARMAVIQVGGGELPLTPVLSASPAAFNFGLSLTNATLQLDNSGNGTLTIESLTENSGGWLTVTSANIADNGLGTYTIRVNRSGLVAGVYRATITIVSSANTITIPVTMEVGSPGATADAGYHYVLLIDPATLATRYQVAMSVSNGSYPFTFNDVRAGEYRLIAGTDSDNDGLICDAGEACGAYPTLDVSGSATLTVDGNRAGLDFTTGFDSSITAATGAAKAGINLKIRGIRRLWQEQLPVQKSLGTQY